MGYKRNAGVYIHSEFNFYQFDMPILKMKDRIKLISKSMPKGTPRAAIKEMANMAHKDDLNTTCWRSPMFQVLKRVLNDDEHSLGETWVPTYLSIKRHDREPIGDWRVKQRIKNALLGEEWEAIEIYPKESRLVDASNQYHLFGWQGVFPIFVFNSRYVLSADQAEKLNAKTGLTAKQR